MKNIMENEMKKNTERHILDAMKKPVVIFDGLNHKVDNKMLDKSLKKVRKVKCTVCLDYCGKSKEDCLIETYDKLIASLQAELDDCMRNPMFEYYVPGSVGRRIHDRAHTSSTEASGEILMLNAKKWASIESRIRFLTECRNSIINQIINNIVGDSND